MNPLLQGHSGITPETSRNVFSINQGTSEDDSQSDPHPEAGPLTSGRGNHPDMVTGVQRERTQASDNDIKLKITFTCITKANTDALNAMVHSFVDLNEN